MKTTNYRLQTEIEHLNPMAKKEWFKNYIRQILESERPYHAKADYIGLSFQELQNKIDYLFEDIKELQRLKKDLTEAKSIALEVSAEVLQEYGIDRIEGTVISSLTLSPQKTKTKEHFKITDEEALIKLGYYKVVVDEAAIKEAMLTQESMDEIDPFVEISLSKEIVPAKLKVNARKKSSNNQAAELLNLVEQQAA